MVKHRLKWTTVSIFVISGGWNTVSGQFPRVFGYLMIGIGAVMFLIGERDWFKRVALRIEGSKLARRVGFGESFGEKETQAPRIEIWFSSGAPYEICEPRSNVIVCFAKIGLKNVGGSSASNCRVSIDNVTPNPGLPMPVILDDNFVLRNDDPEKLVSVAYHFDHVKIYGFSIPEKAPGMFREAHHSIDGERFPKLRLQITVTSSECRRSAIFELTVEQQKILRLQFMSYCD